MRAKPVSGWDGIAIVSYLNEAEEAPCVQVSYQGSASPPPANSARFLEPAGIFVRPHAQLMAHLKALGFSKMPWYHLSCYDNTIKTHYNAAVRAVQT